MIGVGLLAAALTLTPATAVIPDSVPNLTRNYGHPSMHGFKPSEYRGKYFKINPANAFRKCVMWRESRNTYGARNHPSVSSAAGAYQFLDIPWRQRSGSLPWMLHKENKRVYGAKTATRIRLTLTRTPIEKWSRHWQDQAFYTVLNYNGPWSGWHHWTGASCNGLVGR